ncbi:MAG: hypothetical protein Q8P95_02015 [bacterium]|nr:hypothetical protein [bacterium]
MSGQSQLTTPAPTEPTPDARNQGNCLEDPKVQEVVARLAAMTIQIEQQIAAVNGVTGHALNLTQLTTLEPDGTLPVTGTTNQVTLAHEGERLVLSEQDLEALKHIASIAARVQAVRDKQAELERHLEQQRQLAVNWIAEKFMRGFVRGTDLSYDNKTVQKILTDQSADGIPGALIEHVITQSGNKVQDQEALRSRWENYLKEKIGTRLGGKIRQIKQTTNGEMELVGRILEIEETTKTSIGRLLGQEHLDTGGKIGLNNELERLQTELGIKLAEQRIAVPTSTSSIAAEIQALLAQAITLQPERRPTPPPTSASRPAPKASPQTRPRKRAPLAPSTTVLAVIFLFSLLGLIVTAISNRNGRNGNSDSSAQAAAPEPAASPSPGPDTLPLKDKFDAAFGEDAEARGWVVRTWYFFRDHMNQGSPVLFFPIDDETPEEIVDRFPNADLVLQPDVQVQTSDFNRGEETLFRFTIGETTYMMERIDHDGDEITYGRPRNIEFRVYRQQGSGRVLSFRIVRPRKGWAAMREGIFDIFDEENQMLYPGRHFQMTTGTDGTAQVAEYLIAFIQGRARR